MAAPRARLATIFLTLILEHQLSIPDKLISMPMPPSQVLFPVKNLILTCLDNLHFKEQREHFVNWWFREACSNIHRVWFKSTNEGPYTICLNS